jgi:hypothetical protein
VDHEGVGLRGTGQIDFMCPHCGRLLAESMEDRSIFDLVIECYKCKLASEFPRLPQGAAASGYVFYPEGVYHVTETISLPRGVIMIGVGAITGAPPAKP